MMYHQKLVASIKANGKILREFKDTVYCPFGAEYSLLLKNLNTVRALVNVYIDGENQTPGGLVLNAHQEIDLQRSIKNGNLMKGNCFKFIERTNAVEQHRGIKLEDGLIRIEYQFEMPLMSTYIKNDWQNKEWVPGHWRDKAYNIGGVLRNVDYSAGENTRISATAATNTTIKSMNINTSTSQVHDGMATMDCNFNDAGITVPGSKSNQRFSTTTIGALDPTKHTIILKMLGETIDNKPIREPITVKTKQKCVTCGKQNKAVNKFCNECGTSLTIYT